MGFQLPRYADRQRSRNIRIIKHFTVGDEGFYEQDLGFRILKHSAKIIKIEAARLYVRIIRGNGLTEIKTISPRNFVKTEAA